MPARETQASSPHSDIPRLGENLGSDSNPATAPIITMGQLSTSAQPEQWLHSDPSPVTSAGLRGEPQASTT